MYRLLDVYEAIRDFLEMGGPVLIVIGILTLVMWILIFERAMFYRATLPSLTSQVIATWKARTERRSWHARRIREAMLSRVSTEVERYLPLIKTLVALCPLLGLLGTVTGMIEVFEVMAFSGSGNPRSMAAGVSRATIPTMAGMVAALSGLIASTLLSRYANRSEEQLRAELTTQR
jgi:biopolymer transport protein ExbB